MVSLLYEFLSCQYDNYAIHYSLTWTQDYAFLNI